VSFGQVNILKMLISSTYIESELWTSTYTYFFFKLSFHLDTIRLPTFRLLPV
jgi:hypothetical protein